MANRTDAHAPASAQFDPNAYNCWGVFDLNEEINHRARAQMVNQLVWQMGYKVGAHGSGQCGHCGVRIRYAALMVRDDVQEFIWVGEQCLDNRFSIETASDFQRLRKEAKLHAERATKAERLATFLNDYPEMAKLEGYAGDHAILDDLHRSLNAHAVLSEKQIALAVKLMAQADENRIKKADRDADREALLASGVRAPEGRVDVVGTVVGLKWTEDYGYGSTLKMTVKTDAGWLVWVSVPSSIDPERGDRVAFTASVTPSDTDVLFSFGKRPTKAKVLEQAS
jgi:hypothetical protein